MFSFCSRKISLESDGPEAAEECGVPHVGQRGQTRELFLFCSEDVVVKHYQELSGCQLAG